MKKIVFVILAFGFVSMLHSSEIGTVSPSWVLTDTNGVKHHFPTDAKNKTTVIFFWATWCPYCKRLMPHIQSVLYQYQEQLDLQIYAMNINEDADPLEYLTENGYDFLLFPKAEAVAKHYGIKGTPGLFVFDRKGKLQYDLRKVQSEHLLKEKHLPHWQKAAKKAPYWAAELRKTLALLSQ
ncbi:MAG: redoxin domain-containing protein [Proteobacteria bacterium]|nr:redoxin domain-containing protein [Pseudomonadota bacterium]